MTTTKTKELALILDDQHPVVARLIELQGNQSNNKFASRWLNCAGSSWGRVRNGEYHAADQTAMLEKLEGGLAELEDHHSAARAGGVVAEILPLRLVRQGMMAVKRAFAEHRDRLVVVLAPTGGGKTTLAHAIAETYHGRVVLAEATETWRNSYLAACHAIMSASGMKELPGSKRAAEKQLLDKLRKKPKTVVIDEAHYFGPETVNLVKAILNQTQCTVVLLAIPQLWARMKNKAWEESEQLRSRTCALVPSDSVPKEDVITYFDAHLNGGWSGLSKSDKTLAATKVAAAAKQFGQIATVARITRELQEEFESRQSVTTAIQAVQRLRG